jgi:hypothetical protein
MQPTYPWKARLGVGVAMLLLALLGMIVTEMRTTGGWDYWRWVVPVYAILALWLSWYLKRQKKGSGPVSPITLWHEVLHWMGLICAIFLVSHLVHLGMVGRFIAGIFQLILLSLSVFLAGIYIETTFILIGIVLGVFAWLTAVLVQYVYLFIIPIIILGAIGIGLWVWIAHQKADSSIR